jgi:hypothetical protein
MIETKNKPSQPQPASQPVQSGLLTRDQVMAALNAEIAASSLTEVARRYALSPQEISNVRAGRAGFSKRILARLRLRLREFYERLPQ